MKIAAAGDVEVPAYLVLAKRGFEVSLEGDTWMASRKGLTLVGGSPLEVLGLASIHDERGDQWKATDGEIEEFLSRYPPT